MVTLFASAQQPGTVFFKNMLGSDRPFDLLFKKINTNLKTAFLAFYVLFPRLAFPLFDRLVWKKNYR